MGEEKKFKGYICGAGYLGWVPWYRIYMLFSTEQEYYEYVEGDEEK